MSHDCCVAFPHGTMGLLQFVIVVFNDHTHLLFFISYIGYLNLKNDPISHVLLLILVHVLLLSCLYF